MIKLFYTPGSCSLASHIALAEADAEYEAVRVDTAGGEQLKPQYLAINPKGRVPSLVTDQGVLTETMAILSWVADAYADAKLLPADPWERAQALSISAYFATTVHVNHAHGRRFYRWADEESSFADMRRKVPEAMAAAFQIIEDEMLKGPWVMGEAYSVCDPYLFTMTQWLVSDGVPSERFPKVHAHLERMRARPAVGKVLAEVAA